MTTPFKEVYDRGLAIGHSNIRYDTITYRFRDETFTFPSHVALPVSLYNGYWYEAKIDDIRKLEAELSSG
jgi:hypothetical protein